MTRSKHSDQAPSAAGSEAPSTTACREAHHRMMAAMGQLVPSAVYRDSKRAYPGEAGDPLYPEIFAVRRLNGYGS